MDPEKRMERLRDRKLTRRQAKFVQEMVLRDGFVTQSEAAVAAGYPPSSARQRGYELCNERISPHVARELKRQRDERDARYAVNKTRHVRFLADLRDQAVTAGAWTAAIAAEHRRGQVEGLYVSKSEIRHGSIDQMSMEEVENELRTIREGYENFGPIIDVTPIDKEGGAIVESAADGAAAGVPKAEPAED